MVAAPLTRDVLLRDGGTLRLRSPEPADVDDIKGFFEGLTLESRYRRFHGIGNASAIARYYAESDGDARVTLVARHDGEVVAVAGYQRLREPRAAEVAFAVADAEQGRGLGMRMLEQLASIAAERGLERFDADVLSENRRMLAVFGDAGFEVRREGSGGAVRLSLDIRPTERLSERIAARDHSATLVSLRPLVSPRSVAVVGASDHPGSVGGAVLSHILEGGFPGDVAAVNRSGARELSVPAVETIADLDQPPELVVVAVPAAEVVGVAREAGRAGVGALLVLSGGFSVDSEEGRDRERDLLEAVRGHGMRLVGPNSLGIVNTATHLYAAIGRPPIRPGSVAVSSQSGALGIALLGHAASRGIGVASFVSLGARSDVSTNDLLELWEDDDGVSVAVLYVESFGNPLRFSSIARRFSRKKPIVVVKGGRRRPPLRDAASHTAAALHGEAKVDALFRQAGVLRVGSADELFNAADLLDAQPLPGGRSVAMVTNSGGLGTLAVDACLTRALGVAEPSPATRERLERDLPGADRTRNPVDLGVEAAPPDYAAAVEALLDDGAVDAVLALFVQLGGEQPEAVLAAVQRAADRRGKPVVASIVDAAGAAARCGEAGSEARRRVPNLPFPESCAGALALAADRAEWLLRPLGQRPQLGGLNTDAARAVAGSQLDGEGAGWLRSPAVEEMLDAYAIPRLRLRPCLEPDAAVGVVREIAGPVALKAALVAPTTAADLDAVLIGLEGEEAMTAGWAELERRVRRAGHDWHGAVVQPLVAAGADVLVGAVGDRDLGPVVGAGMGGRAAGLGGDVAFRLAPATDADAEDLISGATGLSVTLDGVRGRPALDRASLRDLVSRLSRLVVDVPEIVEIDLNPIRVATRGCVVLDARVRLAPRTVEERVKTW